MSEEVKKKYQIVPNTARVIVELVQRTQTSSGILAPGQLKAGENLYMGKIVHPGSTNFSKGQIVYYSEYSASRIYDFGAMDRGEKSYSEVTDDKLGIFVVAEDDIMAFEEVVDDTGTVSVPAKKDQPKATD